MVRLVDAAWSFFLLYQLARPLQVRMPVACYSMSLALLERIGYWEVGECGIGEDAHTALKAFWATGGEARRRRRRSTRSPSPASTPRHLHAPQAGTTPIFERFECQTVCYARSRLRLPRRAWFEGEEAGCDASKRSATR